MKYQTRALVFALIFALSPLQSLACSSAMGGLVQGKESITLHFQSMMDGQTHEITDDDGMLSLMMIYSYCSNQQDGLSKDGKLACWDQVKAPFNNSVKHVLKFYEGFLATLDPSKEDDQSTIEAVKNLIKNWKAALEKCQPDQKMSDQDFDGFFKDAISNHALDLHQYSVISQFPQRDPKQETQPLDTIVNQTMGWSYGFPLGDVSRCGSELNAKNMGELSKANWQPNTASGAGASSTQKSSQ